MTQYFGVIGNRDYIKLGGERLPYWHFLETQPDGWLSSLVYKRKDSPSGHMLWDCGAWSYKHDAVPKYTPAVAALAMYREYAREGAWLVAPDHMLIDGVDLEARRAINRQYAAEFIRICPPEFVPMAVIHGQTLDERMAHAEELMALGYTHLSVGGVAARAAKKREVLAIVAALREVSRGTWLHVLGLSSPAYMREWRRLGVDSCDGSSHFKQAFAGGAYFTQNGAELTKHKAVRPGEPIPPDMPSCNCTACNLLRVEEVDVRSYGSNEHNMGRACHNQNALMRAQREAMRQTVVLVPCCGQKLDHPAPAADLYQSALFRKARAYAESIGDRWFILSALYGLLRPEDEVAPYDLTLSSLPVSQRREWGRGVALTLAAIGVRADDHVVSLGGNHYSGWIKDSGFDATRPLQGLGIGQQLAWLDANTPPRYEQLILS